MPLRSRKEHFTKEHFTKEEAFEFSRALSVNSTLHSLTIGSRVSEETAELVLTALKRNTSVKELHVRGSVVGTRIGLLLDRA
jgi:hypothetical protein